MGENPWAKARPARMGRLRTWWSRRRLHRDAWIAEQPPANGATPAAGADRTPEVPVLAEGSMTFRTTLPSAHPGLTFTAEFTVDWVEHGGGGLPHPDPDAVLRHALRQRAGQVTATAMLTDQERVRDELAATLGIATEIPDTRLHVRRIRLNLDVDAAQLALAARIAELQRARTVAHIERELEADDVRYLRDAVLADPAVATVWWFRNHQDQPERIPEMAEHFRRAAAAVADAHRAARPTADDGPPRLHDPGTDERRQLLLSVRHMLTSMGRDDLAAQLPAAVLPADQVARAECAPGGNGDGNLSDAISREP